MLHIGDPESYKSAILQLGNLSDGLVDKQVRKGSTSWDTGLHLSQPLIVAWMLAQVCLMTVPNIEHTRVLQNLVSCRDVMFGCIS